MQLKKYGFLNIYIYSGGMFEWLLLKIFMEKIFSNKWLYIKSFKI